MCRNCYLSKRRRVCAWVKWGYCRILGSFYLRSVITRQYCSCRNSDTLKLAVVKGQGSCGGSGVLVASASCLGALGFAKSDLWDHLTVVGDISQRDSLRFKHND